MSKSESSSSSWSSSPAAAGQQGSPRLLRGAPTACCSSSCSSPTTTAKKRLTKRAALAAALCVTAASYVSVLVSNGSRALSTARHHHHQRAGAGSPTLWRPQAFRAAGAADGGGVELNGAGGVGVGRRGQAAGGMHWPAALPNTGRSEGARRGCGGFGLIFRVGYLTLRSMCFGRTEVL